MALFWGAVLDFSMPNLFYFIYGTVPVSSLSMSVRQTASWDSAIYEIKKVWHKKHKPSPNFSIYILRAGSCASVLEHKSIGNQASDWLSR